MTLHRIKDVPRAQWATTRTAQVMLPMENLKRISPDTDLWSALQEMDRDGVNQLPVTTGAEVVGMLSREDVVTYLRTLARARRLGNAGPSAVQEGGPWGAEEAPRSSRDRGRRRCGARRERCGPR